MTVFCMILAALAALIGIALIAVLLIKVRIVFEVTKNQGEAFENSVRITFFGEKLGFNLKDISKNKKQKADKTKEQNDKKLIDKIKAYIETFSVLKKVYSKNRFLIQKRLVLENTKAFIKFGLGDAAATGIATGAVWSLLYQILAFLGCIGTVKDHEFDVVPVYNESGFCMNVKGIISFRLINIIVVAVRLFVTYRSVTKNKYRNKN